MKISSIVCCGAVSETPNKEALLTAPLQIISLINMPSTFSFVLSMGFVDVKGNESIVVVFEDDENNEVNKIDLVFPSIPQELKDERAVGFQMNVDIKNMVFKKEGLYRIKVNHNGIFLIETFFRVLVNTDE